MERTIIAWNFPNWITIVLMAALGYLILGIGSQLVLKQFGGAGPSSTTPSAGTF